MLCLCICAFLAVLYFGLDPKGYDFSNHVSWVSDKPGIRFEKYGIAYTRLGSRTMDRIDRKKEFSIIMTLQPRQLDNNGSGHILTLHSGNDSNQLVIWQYFEHIIAMNDNDYAYRRRTGRVSAPIPTSPAQEIYLSLTTGPGGTTLFFDGQVVSRNRSLRLEMPTGARTTLVLGNSVYGNGPWHGSVSGLALFDRELPPESISALYDAFLKTRSFSGAGKEDPCILYLFNEKEGVAVRDSMGGAAALFIPSSVFPLEKRFLTRSLDESGFTGNLAQDAFVNLVGFIPLGFFFSVVLWRHGIKRGSLYAAYTAVFCFALSITIEVLQAWIPSRSSQFLDLALNTAGGLLGALLLRKAARIDALKFLFRDN